MHYQKSHSIAVWNSWDRDFAIYVTGQNRSVRNYVGPSHQIQVIGAQGPLEV